MGSNAVDTARLNFWIADFPNVLLCDLKFKQDELIGKNQYIEFDQLDCFW